jgi:hypothetical protein
MVMPTDPGTHAGINANEAIALVKDYLWKKPYPGDTRVYQGMTCGKIWDQAYNWNGTTTWTARKFGDSAWMVWAQNSGLLDWVESGWVVYPAFGSILSAGTVYDIDPEIVAKRC